MLRVARLPIALSLWISACGGPAGPSPCPPIEAASDRGPEVPAGSLDPATVEFAAELELDLARSSVLLEGLYCLDDPAGRGEEAEPGATLTVHYTGYQPDGSIFDSSRDRAPFSVLLGAGQVIPGWDLGLRGMRVGGTRTLVIPPHLAYGSQGAGGVIAPNAVLVFEVELLEVD